MANHDPLDDDDDDDTEIDKIEVAKLKALPTPTSTKKKKPVKLGNSILMTQQQLDVHKAEIEHSLKGHGVLGKFFPGIEKKQN